MSSTHRFLAFALLLGVGIGIVTFLGAAKSTGTGSESKDPTQKQGVRDTSRGIVCIGTAETEQQQIPVYPDCFPPTTFPIRIVQVLKKEGDKVSKGEEIATLDSTLPKLMYEKALTGVDEAKAVMAQAKQAEVAHQFAIEVQEDIIGAKEFEITANVFRKNEAQNAKTKGLPYAADALSAAEENIKALQKGVDAEKKKLAGLKQVRPTTKLDQARAAADRAQKDVEIAENLMKQIVYKSPVDGVIQRSSLHDGFVFGPQLRKEPILIQPTGKLHIRAEVLQEYAHRVALNQKAIIYDYTNTSLSWNGKVIKIADTLSQKRSTNGSGGVELFSSGDDPILEVTIELEVDPKAPIIRQGQKVRITLGVE